MRVRRKFSVVVAAALAVVTSLAMVSPAAAMPHGNMVPAAPTPATPSSASASGAVTPQQVAAEVAASATAKADHRPVTVDALTTVYSTVTANPSGSFTFDESVLPQRVRRGKGWVPTSATLARNGDGTYSPAATLGDVTISGGGNGSLATMTDDGDSLSVSWPASLPTPSVSGATATYSGVLPGVDLQVTATVNGGFSDVLVVHNATAAANPALTTLRFRTRVTGVTLHADAAGNLTATDAHGQVIFTGPAPAMWDSNTTLPAGTPAGALADPSSAAHPGLAATQRQVGVQLSGSSLTLVPDRGMLTGPGKHWPMFIDPSFAPQHSATGGKQDFDEVKQGSPCNGVSYFNDAGSDADNGKLGVGYNGFAGGCDGIDRAYYQLAVPSVIWGSTVSAANVIPEVVYAAASGTNSNAVALHWTSGINSKTDWTNQPGAGTTVTSVGFTTKSQTPNLSIGLSVTSTMQTAATDKWSNFTFGLRDTDEASNDDIDFVRFAANPHMDINFDHTPNVPAASNMSSATGTDSLPCATAAPLPWVGKTASVTPPTLAAVVSDPDGDAVEAKFSYGVAGGSLTTLTSAIVSSGTTASVTLPPSFITGLGTTSTTTIEYKATVYDGLLTSASSVTCEFNYNPQTPAAPTVASTVYPPASSGTGPAAGTSGAFTLTAASGESVTTFVSRLDGVPPTGSGACTGSFSVAATSNAATVTLAAPSPGTHTLEVYSCDNAGNVSDLTSYEFTAAGDPNVTYSSLAAAFNNVAIATQSSASGTANADGTSDSLPEAALQAQGWSSGGTVTVDGAKLTLPNYGSGANDNVLAANQTIDVGQTGNALVFLAFGDNAANAAPAFTDFPGDDTEPSIPQGTAVPGVGCSIGSSAPSGCAPPTGSLTYATSSGGTATQNYFLNAPDWVSGPASLAVTTLPNQDTATGSAANPTHIYAFAVPLNPGETLTSVTLPDVSNSAVASVPGLHIIAMGVRNTTTAAAPSGQSWTGSWTAPVETTFTNAGQAWDNQTIRTVVHPSVSGNTVRVTLSNAQNTTPLSIGELTIAPQSSGAATSNTPVPLTFGGSDAVTIPAGTEVTSDPLTLTTADSFSSITSGAGLLVSYQLSNASVADLPGHSDTELGATYVTAANSGNHTADTAATAFSSVGATVYLLTGLDVATSGAPTVAVVGDNLAVGSGTTPSLGVARLSADLAGQNTGYGVLAEGIAGNQVDASRSGAGGYSLLARVDRDILDQPGLTTVVIDEGLADLLAGTSEGTLSSDYTELSTQLNAWGINVIIATLTPCSGYAACTSAVDTSRTDVNTALLGNFTADAFTPYSDAVNLDGAVATPNSSGTEVLAAAADAGDHVNLTATGFQDLLGGQDGDGNTVAGLLAKLA